MQRHAPRSRLVADRDIQAEQIAQLTLEHHDVFVGGHRRRIGAFRS